jgi:predicted nucleotidyltransferase
VPGVATPHPRFEQYQEHHVRDRDALAGHGRTYDSYVYRVLLTGIHLMRTGEVEANLVRLNDEARLPHVTDLIARKVAGPENSTLDDSDLEFHRSEYERLRNVLEASHLASSLPEVPTPRGDMSDLLVRLRLRRSDLIG